MRVQKDPLAISKKVRLLLTKKELELVQNSTSDHLKLHTPHRLKQYIKLARALRSKYRDLTQRQKVASRNTENFRTIEKAKVFDQILVKFEKQAAKSTPPKPQKTESFKNRKIQNKLDHEQHYDLDGVTRKGNKIQIPANDLTLKEEQSADPADFVDLK